MVVFAGHFRGAVGRCESDRECGLQRNIFGIAIAIALNNNESVRSLTINVCGFESARLLSKVQESLELFRIDHFELSKPLGMRLLGQASLKIFSSDSEFENFYIYGVPNLESLAETLRDCQLRERTRRGLATFVKA